MLRDDYAGYYAPGTGGVRLDDDAQGRAYSGLSPTVDESVPGSVEPGPTINPMVTVRDRVHDGYDDDGNPKWSWTDLISGRSAVYWKDRTEVSDAAGSAVVTAQLQILYPDDRPDIAETAQVLADGVLWRVTKVTRLPGRVLLDVERTVG
jgi:hypothetical protein